MLPTKFRFIWQNGFRGEDIFRNQPIRNKNCLVAMFANRSGQMSNLYRETSIDGFLLSFGSFGHEVSEEKIKM